MKTNAGFFEIGKKVKEKFSPKPSYLQKYSAIFTTIDGKEYRSTYKWTRKSGLRCSVPEYLMLIIKEDGYIEADDYTIYILSNVVSIKWELIDEKIVSEDFSNSFKIFFTNEEVEQMHKYIPEERKED